MPGISRCRAFFMVQAVSTKDKAWVDAASAAKIVVGRGAPGDDGKICSNKAGKVAQHHGAPRSSNAVICIYPEILLQDRSPFMGRGLAFRNGEVGRRSSVLVCLMILLAAVILYVIKRIIDSFYS